MRLVLDGRIVLQRMTGAGRYVFEVARRLPTLCPEIDFVVLLRRSLQATPIPQLLIEGGATVRYLDVRVASLAQRAVVPRVLGRIAPDLYHYPFLDLPRVTCPAVITVYDLNPILDTRYFAHWGRAKRWLARRVILSSLRRSDAVLAISEATRTDIEAFCPLAKGKVRVTPLGVDSAAWADGVPVPSVNAAIPEHGTWSGRPYFLYVGVDRPHKNLERAVRGFGRFRAQQKWRSGEGPYFLLAGVGEGTQRLRTAIRRASLETDVLLSPPINEAALGEAYRAATGVIYVSTSEGFGLPILEALAAGAPVIAGDRSSLPEVGGDSVEYCSPLDEASIARAIDRVWADEGLRQTLRERGRVRARAFSWDSTARATGEVYRTVISRHRGNPRDAS